MAKTELDESFYSKVKADLDEGISSNQVGAKYHLGKRRVALIKRSKSYNSYLALRRVERRKQAENTPAKAVPGTSDLEQPSQAYLAETPDGSAPADQVKDTPEGGQDLRNDEQRQAADDAKARAAAIKANRDYQRAELFGKLFAIAVLVFAALGIIALAVGVYKLVTN